MADQLLATLRNLDDRILAEHVPAWPPVGCDLCGYVDCVGDVRVSWISRFPGRDNQWHVASAHLDGWVSGFLLPDSADEQILFEVPS